MKILLPLALICVSAQMTAQNIQFHYDFRHTLDPLLHVRNYPSVSFEYFKPIDSLGSFLFKLQSDLNGQNHNVGQTFIQISQSVKFWDPGIYLSLNYSGGLGVAPPSYGFYIPNAFGIGVSYPFSVNGAWLSVNAQFRYTAFTTPSHDGQLTFYFGRGFFNYRIFAAGSFVGWTENRNQGTEFTASFSGKKVAFFGDPQIWVRVKDGVSAGSRINVYYNLFGNARELNIYPTLGMQYKF